MAWKDNLRQGSFRGIEFFTQDSQASGGRRSVLHQFPNRETPYSEDMGRAARTYTIQGHVIGDDYFEQKRILTNAFEKRGPGELIHPYYGSLFVQVSDINVSESNLEGAIAVFTAKFTEAGNNRFPKSVNDKAAILEENVNKSLVAIKDDFDNSFSISSLPAFAVDSARNLVELSQKTFDDAVKPFNGVAEDLADLAFSTRNLVAETNDSFALLEKSLTIASDRRKSLSSFYDFSDDLTVDESTPIRVQQADNSRSYNSFMKRSSVVKGALAAINSDYTTFEDAELARNEIVDVIEIELGLITEVDGDTFQALSDVKASLVDSLPDVDSDLPSIRKINLNTDSNSLLVSYEEYGNIDSEQDIISRNKIRHPGFVDPLKELEVIDAQ